MARIYELITPLGPDLLFRALRGHEELGRLSVFEVSALSKRADIPAADLLGQNVTVKVELSGGGHRYFNGHVTRFEQDGMVQRYYHYRLTVHPWLWFLTRTADCRIFQNKTVPEIVDEVFRDHGMSDVKWAVKTDPDGRREYCVQYRETAFEFVSRLMEEEGIYYFFEHSDGRHVLKIVNSYAGHETLERKATIPYYPPGAPLRTEGEFIHAWRMARDIQPGTFALDDYDSLKPKVELAVKAQAPPGHRPREFEVYDWPGGYQEIPHGERLVRARIEELHSQFERAEAQCNVRDIAVGRFFTLTNPPRPEQGAVYLITAADYDLRDNAYESSFEEPATYHCAFTALQGRQQFRPARVTPRPTVKGIQSAVVVGPAGEEIWCDKYGRVKVHFHWDRAGHRDENSSCWIRVSHPWAGATWGAIALPRIGQEVIVDFLEGDPDQPIIIGRVYNADQMPPYALPANKTQSGIKSRSSLKGSPANFNEIRFEDKKGEEQLFIHAEKNQDIEVENDETHWVGHDRTKTIDHDETTHVQHDRTETVDNNETITVHGHRTETVDMNETIAVHGNRTRTVDQNEVVTVLLTRTHTVGINEAITVGAAQEITVGAARAVTVGLSQTETFGKSVTTTVGTDWTTRIGKNLQTQVGEDETRTVGKKLHITAGDEIVLTCGQSVITMKKDGTITIKGKAITIDATSKIEEKAMNITSEASAKSLTKGAMVTVEASGVNTVKGSLVKIN